MVAASSLATIWLVDDSPLERTAVRHAFADTHAIVEFEDGSRMLEQLSASAHLPQLLILDWELPGLSGIELCQFIRGSPRMRLVPILMLTGHRSGGSGVVAALAAGANDYVSKPFVAAELVARADALIRMKAMHDRAVNAERALQQLLEDAQDPLIALDDQQRITYANQAACRLIEEPAEVLEGQTLEQALPEWRSRSSIEPGPAEHGDFERKGRVYASQVKPLMLAGRQLSAVTLRDVTEQRVHERRRLDFYSMIAHDLRTPLTGLLLRTDLWSMDDYVPAQPAFGLGVQRMRKQLKDLSALLNDFLDVARMDSVGVQLDFETFRLDELVAEAAETMAPLITAHRFHSTLSVAEGFELHGDRRRLLQVLVNLLANAAKFTPPGGRLELRATASATALEVSVSDTGAGISPEVQGTLFQRFARGEGAARVEGTGLGLVIVREIVEAHGGTVGVVSEAGTGSTFWFRIPRQPAPTSG